MSLTTSGRHTVSARVSVASTTTSWQAGAWTETIPAMPAGGALSHLVLTTTATGNKLSLVEIGIGALGAETVIATIPCVLVSNVGQGEGFQWSILRRLPEGTRVSMRVATYGASAVTFSAAIGYWSGLGEDDDNVDGVETLRVAPTGNWATITTASPAWTASAWAELHAGLAAGAGLVGVAVKPPGTGEDYEIDVGVGAAGAEVVVATLRAGAGGYSINGGLHQLLLPAPYVLSATARIAARSRVSTTSVEANVALLYYGEVPTVEVEETFDPGQSFGPLIWAEILGPDDTARAYAPVTLPDPNSYYLGYKAPELLGVGRVARALSDEHGQYESQRFSTTLDDTARVWRTWLGDADTRLLLNRRVVVRMISEPAWRAKLRPRTVAIGLIRDYRLE